MNIDIVELIQSVKISVDRICLSIQTRHYPVIAAILKGNAKRISGGKGAGWYVQAFLLNGSLIQVIRNRKRTDRLNERFYLQLFQPDERTLVFIRDLIENHVPKYGLAQFNPTVNQLELAMDIVPHNDNDLSDIKDFFDNHTHLKGSRSGSLNYEYTTRYQGKKGHVRKGRKGIRSYRKDLHTGSVIRVEMQFNRPFLKEKKITVSDLLSVKSKINIFDHLEILDDFSGQGLIKIAKTIQARRGKAYSSARSNRMIMAFRARCLRNKIHGHYLERKYQSVPYQKDRFQDIQKRYDFNYSAKKYFQPMDEVTDFLAQSIEKQS